MDNELDASSFKNWPDMLAKSCGLLINKAKRKGSKNASQALNENCTIEICPMNENRRKWKIHLRRDGIKCYQNYGKKNKKIQKKFMDYATRVIKQQKLSSPKKLNNNLEYRYIPKVYECDKKFETSGETCKFYACEPYCIIQTGTYYVCARSDDKRVITICPHIHDNNESWVQKIETWNIILEVIDYITKCLQLNELAMEKIYINFGGWQSQAYTGQLKPSDCHAHINILLTEETIKACAG